MQSGLLSALVTLSVALLVTPLIRKFALHRRIVDSPNHRTVHVSLVPKLGGLSIYLAFVIGVSWVLLSGEAESTRYVVFLIAASAVMLVGLFDDLFGLGCYRKLFYETLAAGAMVVAGFRFEVLYIPFVGDIALGGMGILLSLLWIVGVTNAINLLDGLDGLSAGFSIIVGSTLMIVAGLTLNVLLATIILIYISATLGFLKYNYPPARIFMGDAGSLFLGFGLACLSMEAFTLTDGSTHATALVAAFALPLADTSLAIWRRVSLGAHPFTADNKHVHHRLLETGMSHTTALMVMYTVTLCCGVVAIGLLVFQPHVGVFVMTLTALTFVFVLYVLGCFDFMVKKRVSEEKV